MDISFSSLNTLSVSRLDIFSCRWIGKGSQILSPNYFRTMFVKRPYNRLGSAFQSNLDALNSKKFSDIQFHSSTHSTYKLPPPGDHDFTELQYVSGNLIEYYFCRIKTTWRMKNERKSIANHMYRVLLENTFFWSC